MGPLPFAVQLLIVVGLVTLVYGSALGVPLAAARSSAPAAPRALVTTHLEMLMTSPVLLALAGTLAITGFEGAGATVGAVLVSAGTACLAVGGTLNWRSGVIDQFAERSPGLRANSIGGPLVLGGVVVLAIGIVLNL